MSAIRIAVAVPAYKRPDYLAQLLAGIPPHIAVHVSDNDSSLAGMVPARTGTEISHATSLIPMFENWNRALSLIAADATHVLIPSDDDLFAPGAFERIQAVLEGPGQEADIYIFGCGLVDGDDVTRDGYQPDRLKKYEPGEGFFVFQGGVDARMPGIVFRKSFLDRIGVFDERFKLTAADSELIQRALILGRSIFVPDLVAYYRVWPGGLTHSRQATEEWMREIRLWADKIVGLIQDTHGANYRRFDAKRFRDELLAQNLLSGVAGLVARGEASAAARFLRAQGVPRHARLMTRLRLLRQQLRIAMALRQ